MIVYAEERLVAFAFDPSKDLAPRHTFMPLSGLWIAMQYRGEPSGMLHWIREVRAWRRGEAAFPEPEGDPKC